MSLCVCPSRTRERRPHIGAQKEHPLGSYGDVWLGTSGRLGLSVGLSVGGSVGGSVCGESVAGARMVGDESMAVERVAGDEL